MGSVWIPVFVAIVTAIVTVLGYVFNHKLNAATARSKDAEAIATNAQGELAEAQAKKENAQAESIIITTMKDLLAQIRELDKDKDQQINVLRIELTTQGQRHEDKMTQLVETHASDVETLRTRIEHLIRSDHETRVLLAAHGQWDLIVVAEIRRIHSDFPDPPPLLKVDPDHDHL